MELMSDESELKRRAAAAGLPNLVGRHLAQLRQAEASARELAARLPRDLHWSEEIALTFKLSPRGGAKP
jgi:hypothetical protein